MRWRADVNHVDVCAVQHVPVVAIALAAVAGPAHGADQAITIHVTNGQRCWRTIRLIS